ncbi:YchJ family protein [Neptunomonas sp. XY-337]|uniref:YchJ family protein n=1 Tax=Neptunomonas sp. XY-337 TaxID=2561897 RepID=UPI0010A9F9B2|nr:YchJ family protein [Neptunomonas sp. XY-337]
MLSNQSMTQGCPCDSGKPFAFCCKPFIEGTKTPASAEQLMRSRYSAFVVGAVDYLINTTAEEKRKLIDPSIIEEQVKYTNWIGLSILHTSHGQPDDSTGIVEFEAAFDTGEEQLVLHEVSNFIHHDNRWLYVDGEVEIKPLIQ